MYFYNRSHRLGASPRLDEYSNALAYRLILLKATHKPETKDFTILYIVCKKLTM